MNQDLDLKQFTEPVYRKLLGISEHTPIHDWYDLLGVEASASDEQIEAALVARIQSVRRYQVGAYEEPALQLLSELAKAYVWLTSANEREVYNDLRAPAGTAPAEPQAPASGATQTAWRAVLPGETPSRETASRETATRETAPRRPQAATAPRPPEVAAGLQKEGAARETCPKCGKAMPPRLATCYHCGHRTATPAATQLGNRRSLDASFLTNLDFTPEQLLARLREMKQLERMKSLARPHWTKPTVHKTRRGMTEASAASNCVVCRSPLMDSSDVYGIRHAELCRTREYLATFAKKLEALGKRKFEWPLSESALQSVYDGLVDRNAERVQLLCQMCARRIVRSG